jgi:hypothetical protein
MTATPLTDIQLPEQALTELRDVDITERIPADANARQRLGVLLGKSVRNPVSALTRALRCRPEDVAALLRRRGGKELLALLNESAP